MPNSSKQFMILLHGTGTHNKGAELMAVAVLQHYRRLPNPPEFAVLPFFGPYPDRAKYGLWTVPHARRWGRAKLALALMNPTMRRVYGMVSEEQCSAVIDASGFAFGDQHGPDPTRGMAENCRRWKQQGKKVVLLPQAFGPFGSPEIREACRAMLDHCDLVFARDETSLAHLTDAAGQRENVRIAPDFTMAVEGRLPEDFPASDEAVFIVPNQRMLDKTDAQTRAGYLPLLARAIDHAATMGLRPVVLLHAPEDAALAPRLAEFTQGRFDTLQVPCPVQLKGILGTGRLVIGSRFHALVGALSQGVPVLAIGWSHKYVELLRQFDSPEGSLAVDELDRLPEKMKLLLDSPLREQIIARIHAAGNRLRDQIDAMWAEVDRVVGLVAIPDAAFASP